MGEINNWLPYGEYSISTWPYPKSGDTLLL